VIFYGPVGVGKTHLAIRHGADVRFAKTSRVLAGLACGTRGRRLIDTSRRGIARRGVTAALGAARLDARRVPRQTRGRAP